MVNSELLEAYERLNKKRELYKLKTKYGTFIERLGTIISLLSAFFIIPFFLNLIFGLNPILLWLGGFLFGVLLSTIGAKINWRALILKLSFNEEAFLEVFDSMKDIEVSKFDAAKRLSKFEERINIPTFDANSLWNELTKEVSENLHRLKKNIRERVVPSITQSGEGGDITKVHLILENFAKYVLNPTISELKELNQSMLELPKKIEIAQSPFFVRYPNLRLPSIIIIFGFLALVLSYLSVIFSSAPHDTALLFGATIFGSIFGTLSFVYVTVKYVAH